MANKEGHVGGVPRVRGLLYELISYFDKGPIVPRIRKISAFRLNPDGIKDPRTRYCARDI